MRALGALLAVLLACAAPEVAAWPERAVRIIVPYPPGGGIDVLGRQLAAHLAARWDRPVVVDNRPGGSTIPGTDAAARAADGHTVLLTTDASISINPLLFTRLPYDPRRDFTPVSLLVTLHQVLVAHAGAPVHDLRTLVHAAKEAPGRFAYASFGSGSQPHLAGELLKHEAGIDLLHVAYKGPSLAVPAVAAGEVHLAFASIGVAMPLLSAGKLKALGISGPQRSALLPQVPTFAEQGYPGVESRAWFGLFLPANAPAHAVRRLAEDARALLADAAFRSAHLAPRGYEVVAGTPSQFAEFLEQDRAAWARALRLAGVRAE